MSPPVSSTAGRYTAQSLYNDLMMLDDEVLFIFFIFFFILCVLADVDSFCVTAAICLRMTTRQSGFLRM